MARDLLCSMISLRSFILTCGSHQAVRALEGVCLEEIEGTVEDEVEDKVKDKVEDKVEVGEEDSTADRKEKRL